MITRLFRSPLLVASVSILVAACSTAKLEARLEANPQCKDVVNPKTGALMPCPGSDKSFYREVGLAPAKVASVANNPVTSSTAAATSAQPPLNKATMPTSASSAQAAVVECKPQIHKKTGGTMPCPAPD
jgi:hypothetical protein